MRRLAFDHSDKLSDAEIEPLESATTDRLALQGPGNHEAPASGAYVTLAKSGEKAKPADKRKTASKAAEKPVVPKTRKPAARAPKVAAETPAKVRARK